MVAACLRNGFFFFFFSSRRRHTRSLRDWSSDVCSSDLEERHPRLPTRPTSSAASCGGRRGCRSSSRRPTPAARRSEERRVGKSVDLGGRRIIKKKNRKQKRIREHTYADINITKVANRRQ